MADAYWDYCGVVPAEVIHGICDELGAKPSDFDGLIPLYKSYGTKNIGRECDKCGAPLGSLDPDECAWVMLGVCSDCREP